MPMIHHNVGATKRDPALLAAAGLGERAHMCCQTNANRSRLGPDRRPLRHAEGAPIDNLGGEEQTGSMPPILHRLMGDADVTLVEQVLHVAQ
jgi:hypothetical protein